MLSPEGIAQTRKRVAEELRDFSKKLDAELRDRRERLVRTEDKMRGLVDLIATGDRSEYVVSTLRDLETFTRQEREALADLERTSHEPLRLPSIEEVCAQEQIQKTGKDQTQDAKVEEPWSFASQRPSSSADCASRRAVDLDARLAQDPEAGREQLRRWLKDGTIRIGPTKDGAIAAEARSSR